MRVAGDTRSRRALVDVPERTCVLALVAFALAWFVFVAISATATPWPFVLSDEANYLLPSLFGYRAGNYERWGIIAQIPNVLYFRIYGLLPGAEIYGAAKLLNAAFVVAAAAPAYATARIYLRPHEAAVFAVVVVAAPVSTFARYFMPESLFHFGFWCVVWILLRAPPLRAWVVPLAAGVALGLLSLVKPHALALLAGAGALLLLRVRPAMARWRDAVGLVACFYAARIVIARLLGETWHFSLGGPAYTAVLVSPGLVPESALINAFGHLAALALLAALPLCVVAAALLRDLRRSESVDPMLRELALLAWGTLLAALAMTIWFSSAIHAVNPESERITRLHGRYYAYILPLIMLAAVVAMRRGRVPAVLATRFALPVAAGVAALAGWIVARHFETGIVDYPELGVLLRWPWGALVVAAAVVAAFADRRMTGRQPWGQAAHVLPVVWWASVVVATSVLALAAPLTGKRFVANEFDRSMLNDATLRGLRHRADGLVIGTHGEPEDAYRVMFHLASMSRGRLVDSATVIDGASIPADVHWLILLPGVTYAGPGQLRTSGPLAHVELRSARP